MTDLDIIKECRQTGRTRTTTRKLLEKGYYEQMTKKQYPINDWEFVEDIENNFNDWFHSNHTDYSLKSEYFYGDCEIGDVKTRQDMLKKWIYASFYEGFMRGKYAKLEDQVELKNND